MLEKISKYLAITSIWAAIGVIGWHDPLTIIYGGLIGLVATAFIIYHS